MARGGIVDVDYKYLEEQSIGLKGKTVIGVQRWTRQCSHDNGYCEILNK